MARIIDGAHDHRDAKLVYLARKMIRADVGTEDMDQVDALVIKILPLLEERYLHP